MRIFRPFRSSSVWISRRNQPPICAPVLPEGKLMMLYDAYSSRMSARPPPCCIHAFCWRALSPNGTAVPNANVGSLPK